MNSTSAKAFAWNLNNIVWQEISPDGTKYSLLEGRRDIAGEAFTYAFFIPAGFWDPAHWHTADARITVLQGKLYLGYGDKHKHKDDELQAFEVGSYILATADAKHFDGSYEDTVIIGTAVGPWATYYVDSSVIPSAGTQPI